MNPDPAHQYSSPYLAMGNNWSNAIDSDGDIAWVPGVVGAVVGAGFAAYNVWGDNSLSFGQKIGKVALGAGTGAVLAYTPAGWGGFAYAGLVAAGSNIADQMVIEKKNEIDLVETGANVAFTYLGLGLGRGMAPSVTRNLRQFNGHYKPYFNNGFGGILARGYKMPWYLSSKHISGVSTALSNSFGDMGSGLISNSINMNLSFNLTVPVPSINTSLMRATINPMPDVFPTQVIDLPVDVEGF